MREGVCWWDLNVIRERPLTWEGRGRYGDSLAKNDQAFPIPGRLRPLMSHVLQGHYSKPGRLINAERNHFRRALPDLGGCSANLNSNQTKNMIQNTMHPSKIQQYCDTKVRQRSLSAEFVHVYQFKTVLPHQGGSTDRH
jgi:hypothetical protein